MFSVKSKGPVIWEVQLDIEIKRQNDRLLNFAANYDTRTLNYWAFSYLTHTSYIEDKHSFTFVE